MVELYWWTLIIAGYHKYNNWSTAFRIVHVYSVKQNYKDVNIMFLIHNTIYKNNMHRDLIIDTYGIILILYYFLKFHKTYEF